MKVAKYYNNSDVRIEEMTVPSAGTGEILVKIMASGICGSDVMEWYRIKKAPLVLGHEIAGEVAETGVGVAKFEKGDRVTVAHHVPCNTCHYCFNGNYSLCDTLRSTNFDPGGFCEYVRVPQINVDRGTFLLPDEVSYEDATFAEPLACVLRGQRRACFKPGQSVLVIGSGISGLLHIKLAKALGAGRIIATDVNEFRINSARKCGADFVFNAKEFNEEVLKEINDGRLADLVILCAGAVSAMKQSLNSVDRGGTLLLFALPSPGTEVAVDFWNLWREGITITSSYAGPPGDTTTAIELIRAKRVVVDDMITHRIPLDKTAEGFRLVADAKNSIKVIVEPQK